MIFCRSCGSTCILARVATALFVPVNPNTGDLVFEGDRETGKQAKVNVDIRSRIYYCPRCSSYFRCQEGNPEIGREVMSVDAVEIDTGENILN